ncbi:L-arabinose transport system permease protein AraP [Lachnospiraceae bacterium]|nr:L-arabinose transport system permease protein AraP [Lachnospiraceae bacterium]
MKMKRKKDTVKFFLFISPWIIGFLLFILIPMGMSLYYSFTDWDVLTKESFVGMANYAGLFQDPLFYKSLQVTGVYTLITVPLNVFLSLMTAILLNMEGRFMAFFRTLYYIPAVLSAVVVAILWQWIFNSKYGLLNDVLTKFGIEGPRWLSDPQWVMPALVIMSIWGIGGGIIMYLAGLQAVPKDLYEAATLDGARFWKKLFHITIPSMSPIILFTFLTSLIATLQTFSQAYIMTSGGPNHATLFYAYYLYQNGVVYKKMGKACAMAWLFFIAVMLLSLVVLKVSGKVVYYESEEGGKLA